MSQGVAVVANAIGTLPPSYVVQGQPVSLPAAVRDATSMSAMFVVSAPAVRRLIRNSRLHVPELFPGRTLCMITGIEYRDSDLGACNEVAITFFVKCGGSRPTPLFGLLSGFRTREIGTYVHRLPVTTSFSRDAGRDIWGFPRTVDDVEFREEEDRRICRLVANGAHVLTLSVARGGRRRVTDMAVDAYVQHDGKVWKTPFRMSGEDVGTRLGGASITLGAHAVADELRTLGLPKPPFVSTWVGKLSGTLDAPEQL
jgi:hypothetical protein